MWHTKENQAKLDAAIATFPQTFGLSAFPGDTFKIDTDASYVNDSGVVMLCTAIKTGNLGSTRVWESFAKGSPEELRGEIVAAPEPTRREVNLAVQDAVAKLSDKPEPEPAPDSTIKSFYVSMVYDLLGVFIEYRADTQRAVELYLEKHYLRDGTWKLPWCAVYHTRPAATSSTLPLHIVKAQCGNIYEADYKA